MPDGDEQGEPKTMYEWMSTITHGVFNEIEPLRQRITALENAMQLPQPIADEIEAGGEDA